MQVSEKDHVRETYRTLAPLNYMLKIIGLGTELGCNLADEKKPKSCWVMIRNIFRASVIGILDFYTLSYKINYLTANTSPSIMYTDYVQAIYDFLQYGVDLYFVRKYGSVCSKYFKQYEVIDRILVTVNYCTFTKQLWVVIGFFLILWLSSSVCDFTAWVLSYGWEIAFIYALMYSYIFLLIKILTTLDLTSQIMHIECRLRAMGDLLEKYCNATESCSPLFERNKKKWAEVTSRVDDPQTRSNYIPPTLQMKELKLVNYHEVKWLSRCYLLLSEQAAFVNKMYGTRILLNSLSLLIDMVRFTNIGARILIGSQKTKYYSGYMPVVSSIMRLLTCAAVLLSMVAHCERVYTQKDRIMDIIYNLLIFKNPDENLKTAVSELRDLIQARPIDFTLANFFRLDYSLLASIASVVVTYTIILLQSLN